MPAVVLVLGMCVGAVVGAAAFVAAQDAAGEVARLAARGDDTGPAVPTGAAANVWDAGDLRCARVTVPVRLLGMTLPGGAQAESCALRDLEPEA